MFLKYRVAKNAFYCPFGGETMCITRPHWILSSAVRLIVWSFFFWSLGFNTLKYSFFLPDFLNLGDEILFVVCLSLFVASFNRESSSLVKHITLLYTALFFVLIISGWMNTSKVITIFHFIISYGKASVILLLVSACLVTEKSAVRIIRFFLVIVVIQIPIGFAQALLGDWRVNSDIVTGFTRTGNNTAFTVWNIYFCLYMISSSMLKSGKNALKRLFVALISFILFVFSNSKHMVPGFLAAVLLILFLHGKLSKRAFVLLIFSILMIAGFAIPFLDFYYGSTSVLYSRLQYSSKFQIVEYLWNQFSSYPGDMLFGNGPGMFISNFSFFRGTDTYAFFDNMYELLSKSKSVMDIPAGSIYAIIGEIGLVGFGLVCLIFAKIVGKCYSVAFSNRSRYKRHIAIWSIGLCVFILWESLFFNCLELLDIVFIPCIVIGVSIQSDA